MSEKEKISILFIGDIVGEPGINALSTFLPSLKKQHKIHAVFANGENCHNGKGLTEKLARQLFSIGVDVITGGNHIFNNYQFRSYLDTSTRILRPLNYPTTTPGHGSTLFETSSGHTIGVINLQGLTFMNPIRCPFELGEEEAARLAQKTNIIFVDFHAEASAEKIALAWHLDGKISAMVGTHTHVQTADEQIFPQGMAYITDVGMTGPTESVIGLDVETALKRFIKKMPERYVLASANTRLNAVVIDINTKTGRALDIKRINLP